MPQHSNRRRFLRNLSVGSLSLGMLPGLASTARSPEKKDIASCMPTTEDYYGEGPFYTANPPALPTGQLAGGNEPGQRIIISGRVQNTDCTEFIPNTEIDIWHANDAGQYDNSGYNLRGVVTSNSQGFYIFESIRPGKYLNGNQYRPSHIHFKITPPGHPTLTTQLYFEGDSSIANDAAASIASGQYDASGRIIPLAPNSNGVLEGTWDIMLDGDGQSTGLNSLHLEKGMLYSLSPNPFRDEVEIRYGVFRPAKISLLVFDLEGRMVATLEERHLEAEKYSATWRPQSHLPKGHYFVCLKANDQQVHYLRLVKE